MRVFSLLCATGLLLLLQSTLRADQYDSVLSQDPAGVPSDDGPVISQDNSGWQPPDDGGASSDNEPVVQPVFIWNAGPGPADSDPTGDIVQQALPGNNALPFLQGWYQMSQGKMEEGRDTMISGTWGNLAGWGAARAFAWYAGGSFFLPEVVIGGTVAWATSALYMHWKNSQPTMPDLNQLSNQTKNSLQRTVIPVCTGRGH